MYSKRFIFASACFSIIVVFIYHILSISYFKHKDNGQKINLDVASSKVNNTKKVINYEKIFEDIYKSYLLIENIEKISYEEFYGAIAKEEKKLRDAMEIEYSSKIREISTHIKNADCHEIPLANDGIFDNYLIPYEKISPSSVKHLAHTQKMLIELRSLDKIISMGNRQKINEYYSLKEIIVALLEISARNIEGRRLARP